jgi:hypothetical protein
MWNAIAELVLLPVLAQAGAGVGATRPDAGAAASTPLLSYSIQDARLAKARSVVLFGDGSVVVAERAGPIGHTAKGTLAHDAMDEIGKLVDDLPDAQPVIGPPAAAAAAAGSIIAVKHGVARGYPTDAKAAAALAKALDALAEKMLEKADAGGAHQRGGVVPRPKLTRPGTGALIGLPRPTILPGPPATGVRH